MSNQDEFQPIRRRHNTRSRRDTPLINPDTALNGRYWQRNRTLEEEESIEFETIETADETGNATMSAPTFDDPEITHLLDNIFKDEANCQGDIARAFEEEGINNYEHFSTYDPNDVKYIKHKNASGTLQDLKTMHKRTMTYGIYYALYLLEEEDDPQTKQHSDFIDWWRNHAKLYIKEYTSDSPFKSKDSDSISREDKSTYTQDKTDENNLNNWKKRVPTKLGGKMSLLCILLHSRGVLKRKRRYLIYYVFITFIIYRVYVTLRKL